jgi:hypothetical protein
MSTQHLAQLGGHCDGDVEVRHRQHLRPAAFKPLLRLGGVALWTAAVATRVVREHLGVALVATPDLATERGGAAVEDVFDVRAASTRREPRGSPPRSGGTRRRPRS